MLLLPLSLRFKSRSRHAVLAFSLWMLVSFASSAEKALPTRLLSMCSSADPIRRKGDKKALAWLLDAAGEGSLMLKTSPQHLAACWMFYKDKLSRGRSRGALLQRFALATLYYGTTRSNTTDWDWPVGSGDDPSAAKTKGNWMNPRIHECQWYGVACGGMMGMGSVVRLEFGFLALDGLLPRDLGLLTELRELDVHGCDLQGVLPHKMLVALGKLEYLRLHMNGFFGAIHKEVVGLKSLKKFIGFGNYFGESLMRHS